DLRPETIAAMVECDAVCEHLHLPLQAGSDRTLARMHRGYTAERYLQKLAAARDAIPDLAVTTDLIVGFPGETEDDFRGTLEVVDEAAYDAAYTFVFSPRPGTPAAEMTEERVPPEVAQDRMRRLVEVVERHALRRHDARVGRVEEVLVDGPSKKDPAVLSGRTRQNKLVHFPSDGGDDAIRPGALVEVRVTRAAPHWLRGEPMRVVAPPRARRTRIPLAVV
ncbi:MAG TPA: radical SAM protein, partial [Acidimicrobiia bacterium]|nr:radical SAM protein [Acidimicrobiia bacterium]